MAAKPQRCQRGLSSPVGYQGHKPSALCAERGSWAGHQGTEHWRWVKLVTLKPALTRLTHTQTPQCAKDWESPAPRRVHGQLVEGRSLSLSWSLSDVGSHH